MVLPVGARLVRPLLGVLQPRGGGRAVAVQVAVAAVVLHSRQQQGKDVFLTLKFTLKTLRITKVWTLFEERIWGL